MLYQKLFNTWNYPFSMAKKNKAKNKKEVKTPKKTQTEKDKKINDKIKITYNKKALFSILVLSVLLVITLFWTVRIIENQTGKGNECKVNEDCVIQQTTCCPCTMGGEEKCMPKQEAQEVQQRLDEECDEDLICIALFNCMVESCSCDDGSCVDVLSE
jgi:hypothetical protein